MTEVIGRNSQRDSLVPKLSNILTSPQSVESLEFNDVELRETDFHGDIMFPLQVLPKINLKYQSELHIIEFKNTQHFADGSNSKIHKTTLRGEIVILKVMKDADILNEKALIEFNREITIISRLSHPHIINLYGSGVIESKLRVGEDRPWIALEFLEWGSLHDRIDKAHAGQLVPAGSYIRFAKELSDALHFLHELVHPECILIHRDLKPVRKNFSPFF